MNTLERDEDDPDFKKVPPLSIYEFKGVSLGTTINMPEKARNRKCTNVFCCFPVLLITLATVIFAIYVVVHVDVRRFVNGEDKCGNICGVKNTKVTIKRGCEAKDYTDKMKFMFNRCISNAYKGSWDIMFFLIFDILFESGVSMLVAIIIALVFSLVILAAFRYQTACTFWFFVIITILFVAVSAVLSWYTGFIPAAILFTILLVVYCILLVFLWKSGRYKLVIAIIAEASIAIFKSPVLLIFPLMTVLVLLAMDAVTFYMVMEYLANPKNGLSDNVFIAFWIVWTFGMVLMHAFINGFQWMVIAGSVATYYFTKDKNHVGNSSFTNSLYRTMRYHLGTIAAGSLIITTLTIARMTADVARDYMNPNSLVTVILLLCMLCIISCLEEIAEYLAKKAYVITAIHGKGLLDSGKRAVRLMWYFFIDLLMVDNFSYMAVGGAAIAISLVSLGIGLAMHLDNLTWYFIFFVIIGGHLVGTVTYFYFSVLNASIETIFICFCEDKLMNDGSTARPYFMTKRLSKLMVECTDIAQTKLNKKRESRLERQRQEAGDQN